MTNQELNQHYANILDSILLLQGELTNPSLSDESIEQISYQLNVLTIERNYYRAQWLQNMWDGEFDNQTN